MTPTVPFTCQGSNYPTQILTSLPTFPTMAAIVSRREMIDWQLVSSRNPYFSLKVSTLKILKRCQLDRGQTRRMKRLARNQHNGTSNFTATAVSSSALSSARPREEAGMEERAATRELVSPLHFSRRPGRENKRTRCYADRGVSHNASRARQCPPFWQVTRSNQQSEPRPLLAPLDRDSVHLEEEKNKKRRP